MVVKPQTTAWKLLPNMELWSAANHQRRYMLLMSGIWAMLSFGFYGFAMWTPELLSSRVGGSEHNLYLINFVIKLGNLPGNILSIVAIDRVGRKVCLVASIVLSGCCVFGVLGVHTVMGSTVFFAVFNSVSVVAWNALDVIGPELFATHLRAEAFGLQASVGRLFAILGNLSFGTFSGSDIAIPLALTGASLVAGGILGLFLPETRARLVD